MSSHKKHSYWLKLWLQLSSQAYQILEQGSSQYTMMWKASSQHVTWDKRWCFEWWIFLKIRKFHPRTRYPPENAIVYFLSSWKKPPIPLGRVQMQCFNCSGNALVSQVSKWGKWNIWDHSGVWVSLACLWKLLIALWTLSQLLHTAQKWN